MNPEETHTGFAIALAWPQTYCKEPGAWYDHITRWLGINRNNYYKAGHAALVLIEEAGEKCHYFDFGRYHAPFQHGRVRSAETDHDLELKTIPQISRDGKTILNFKVILEELQQNPAYHGEGNLYASYIKVDFKAAHDRAMEMQKASPIPYGPFIRNGSNCSRFVNTVIRAGNPKWNYKLRLKLFVPFTPTPLNNVHSLQHRLVLAKMRKNTPFFPLRRLSKTESVSTLPQPERHPDIPENAQWLGGEGAGSWFVLEFQKKLLRVTRYSPDGIVECSGLYEEPNGHLIDPNGIFKVNYPSNCKEVNLKCYDGEMLFERILL
jgi:hypothetical protein